MRWQAIAVLLFAEPASKLALAQEQPAPGLIPRSEIQGSMRDSSQFRSQFRATYVLGTNDAFQLRVAEWDEVSDKTFRIESDGDVNLPFLGRVRASGMTIEALEKVLMREIQPYIKASSVSISLVQFRTEVVYLLGAFRNPGAHQLLEHRNLADVVALSGGLAPTASRRLRLTRRLTEGPIPLQSAVVDNERNISSVEIVLTSLMEAQDPTENLILRPFDTVTALRNEMIYISGEVAKPGAYELTDRDSMTVMQAVALAGGLSRDAQPSKARVLRPVMDTNRRAEIPIDLNRVFSGLSGDFRLMANDALYVPRVNQRKGVIGQMVMYTIPAVLAALIVSAIQ
jgi:polysaccharide export outer membrane protein